MTIRKLFRRAGSALALTVGAGAMTLAGGQVQALTVTMSLSQQAPPSATQVVYDLLLDFPGAPGDEISALQLNLEDSDLSLSRFTFIPDATTLAGWVEFSPIDPGPGFYAPFDPFDTLQPSASTLDLGDLVIDLTGLPASTTYSFSLLGGTDPLRTDLAGLIGGEFVDSFNDELTQDDPAVLAFGVSRGQLTTVDGPANVIPEPMSAGLSLLGLVALTAAVTRRSRLGLI